MSTMQQPREPETLTCDICLIPVSEARSEEAVDYVLHFCGLDCYSRWKARDAPAMQLAIAEDTPAQQGDKILREKRDGAAIELPLVWQRVVDADGRTRARCNTTRNELERAMRMLREVLRPLRIEPVLYTKDIDLASFQRSPSESNRVDRRHAARVVAGRAQPGSSRCCGVCGPMQCRTVTLDGQVFEAIPFC